MTSLDSAKIVRQDIIRILHCVKSRISRECDDEEKRRRNSWVVEGEEVARDSDVGTIRNAEE